MSEKATESAKQDQKGDAEAPWRPPEGTKTKHSFASPTGALDCTVHAGWIELHGEERPEAALFHVAYLLDQQSPAKRPVTFVFNGGPGAASAYLHVGALGPLRVEFTETGGTPPPPVRLVDNMESWLPFTDLVFLDPIGTGFSRTLLEKSDDDAAKTRKKEAFWEVKRDLESLCECMWRFLTSHQRWTSPVFLAGESYGGFRVACLARMAQEDFGIGLNGSILISPAIELSSLVGSDYSLLSWIDMFPSMAAAAHFHEKTSGAFAGMATSDFLGQVERFAREELALLLVQGESMNADKRNAIFATMSGMLGLPQAEISAAQGRIRMEYFCRALLKEKRLVCAPHDASLTCVDPFPDRLRQEGPDPALSATSRLFTSGINALIRERLQVDTHLPYHLLNLTANQAWKDKTRAHFVENSKGAMDDLRYSMALNPYMGVMIVHGIHDLVTPYLSSQRLVQHMQLDPSLQKNLQNVHYHGGHMFYSWESSRKAFRDDVSAFYTRVAS